MAKAHCTPIDDKRTEAPVHHRTLRWLLGAVLGYAFSLPVSAQWSVPPAASLDVPAGSLVDLACMPLDMQGTLNLDSGTLSVDASAYFGPDAVVSSNGGILSVGGDLTVSGALDTGLATLVLRDGCVSNTTRLQGNLVLRNLTLSSTTGRTFVLPAGANVTVLDRLDIQGVAGANVQVTSAGGTATINLGPGATVTRTFATVSPNVQIGAAPPAVSAAPIPTLGTHAIALLSLLVAGLAVRSRKAG